MNKISVITCILKYEDYTVFSFPLHLVSFDITNHNTAEPKGK